MGDLLIEQEALTQKVIRIAGPDAACNCHGWVFTGGRYGVATEDVDAILADNGYQIVEEAREGDVIIYRDELGQVRHSGLVRFVGTDGLVLVESKWGSLGIYLHTPKEQPYGEFLRFLSQFPSEPRVESGTCNQAPQPAGASRAAWGGVRARRSEAQPNSIQLSRLDDPLGDLKHPGKPFFPALVSSGAVLPAVAFDRGDRGDPSRKTGRVQERTPHAGQVLDAQEQSVFLCGSAHQQGFAVALARFQGHAGVAEFTGQ